MRAPASKKHARPAGAPAPHVVEIPAAFRRPCRDSRRDACRIPGEACRRSWNFGPFRRGTRFAIPRNDMTTESPLVRLALVTKTLGHPARLRILAMLRHNRLSV